MHKVEIDDVARERYRDCINAIFEAQKWCDLAVDEEDLKQRRAQYASMERSFLSNAARLLFESNNPAHDGDLRIYPDGAPLSFYWRYERSGYHGGLIYHPIWDGEEKLPVGTWSIHT